MRKCQFPNCFLAFARANSQIYEFPLETRQAKRPAVIDGLFAYFSYKKGACPDQRNKRPIALKYIKAFLAFVQYQKQNAGKMRRDAEKKDLVGPRQRSGLAMRQQAASDGREAPTFFFVAGTRLIDLFYTKVEPLSCKRRPTFRRRP